MRGGCVYLGAAFTMLVAAGTAFGAGEGVGGGSGSCARWLDGAIRPIEIEPVTRVAGDVDSDLTRVLDERVLETQQLVRQHPLDPPRAARAYVASMLAGREALLSIPDGFEDERHLAVERAFVAAASGRGIYAPATAGVVAAAERAATPREALAMAAGVIAAARVLAAVADDGSDRAARAEVKWDSDPGRAARAGTWVPTAPGFTPPLQPGWGEVRGIGIDPLAVRPDIEPPAWTSAEMDEQRQAFLAMHGEVDPRLVDLGHQWNDGAGTSTPAGTWLDRADDATRTLAPELRLDVLAATGVALHDAFVLTFDRKYEHMTARPIQWMRTGPRPAWKPYITTPPFPSWPSGHALVSSAAASVIGRMVPKVATAERAAAREAADSRVWAGIHWQVDSDDGVVLGAELVEALADAGSCA